MITADTRDHASRLAEHERDPSQFVDKATGEWFLSNLFRWTEPTMLEPTDDLTERGARQRRKDGS